MERAITVAVLKGIVQMPDADNIISRTHKYLKDCPNIEISDKAKMMIEYVAVKLIKECQLDLPTTMVSLDFADSLLFELHQQFFSDNLSKDEKKLFEHIFGQIKMTAYDELLHLIHKNRMKEIRMEYGIEEDTDHISNYYQRCKHTRELLLPLFSRYQAFRSKTMPFSNKQDVPLEATVLIKRLVKNYETYDSILSWMLRPTGGDISIAKKHVNLFDAVNFLPVIHHVIKETISSETHGKEIYNSISGFILEKFSDHTENVLTEMLESNVSDQKRNELISITQTYLKNFYKELVAEQEQISYIPMQPTNTDCKYNSDMQNE